MDVYKENGFDDRNDYLEHLSEEYCVDILTVHEIADLLGQSEDFDGLISILEDLQE